MNDLDTFRSFALVHRIPPKREKVEELRKERYFFIETIKVRILYFSSKVIPVCF
jgi:hypothetical protein